MIKVIETEYKGYKFRSRLEARWAVFFDSVGIRYEYEKEGFDLGEAGKYLPDFWLPDLDMWMEVKGDNPTEEELKKCQQLAIQTNKFVGMLLNDIRPYTIHFGKSDDHGNVDITLEGSNLIFHPDGGELWGYHLNGANFRICQSCGKIFYISSEIDICMECESRIPKNIEELEKVLQEAYTKARQARFEHGEKPD